MKKTLIIYGLIILILIAAAGGYFGGRASALYPDTTPNKTRITELYYNEIASDFRVFVKTDKVVNTIRIVIEDEYGNRCKREKNNDYRIGWQYGSFPPGEYTMYVVIIDGMKGETRKIPIEMR